MVDLNAHEAGNGGKKPREAYSSPSLLYSEMDAWQLLRVLPLASVERLSTSLQQTALQCASWTLVGHKQKRLRRRLPGLAEQPRHMSAM